MKNALILLAGGIGKRMRSKDPKQFLSIGNTNLIEYFLSNLDHKIFDIIVIAVKKEDKEKYIKSIIKKIPKHNIKTTDSGETRQISTKNSLKYLKKFNPKNVLIHDSARPLTSNFLIIKILKQLKSSSSSIPYIKYNDLMIFKKNFENTKNEIINIQTPQGFNFKKIYKAHMLNKSTIYKDDSSVFKDYGQKIKLIKGEFTNIKITTKEDIENFNRIKIKNFKSGIGYDIHKIDFNSKKKLTLCGLKINHPPLIGHSDADVGYHAICDSILGSLSMRDMGYYFSNKNSKWKNVNSKIFINFCKKELIIRGYKIVNIDINFICEKPNINKVVFLMKKNISKLLNISENIISIKATTNEKVGIIGDGKAIAAESIVQIVNV